MTPAELRQKLRAMERKQGRFENELGLVSYSGDVLALTDAQADALLKQFELDVIEGVLRKFDGPLSNTKLWSYLCDLKDELAQGRAELEAGNGK